MPERNRREPVMRHPPTVDGHPWHESVTIERVTDAVHRRLYTLDNPGFCLSCGEDADGCEPDARGYCCEFCNEDAVYGADELLMYFY